MKKNMKRYILLSIIVLMIVSLFLTTNNVMANGSYTVKTNSGPVTLTDSVTYIDFGFDETLILKQSNIFCVEKGPFAASEYYVGEEHTVSDPALAYILYNGPTQDIDYPNYKYEKSQIALWYYFKNNTDSYDYKIITSNGEVTQDLSEFIDAEPESDIKKAYNDGIELYNKAKEYADKYYKTLNAEPSITTTYNEVNNTYKIEITGAFEDFKLQINDGEEETPQKGENETFERTINADSPSITVKVTPLMKVYIAKYRVLTQTNLQRLIVVTSLSNETKIMDSEDITFNDNVSLEKFIMGVNLENPKVNESQLNDGQTDMTERCYKMARSTSSSGNDSYMKINYNIDSKGDKDDAGKDITKFSNPVNIQAGDLVTYQIMVYDNNTTGNGSNNITVFDSLSLVNYSSGDDIVKPLEIGEGKDIEIVSVYAQSCDGEWHDKTRYKDYFVTDKNEIKIRIYQIAAGESVKIRLTLKINRELDDDKKLKNYAELHTTCHEHRWYDADYVEMKNNLSLQKYIKQINNNSLTQNDLAQINDATINFTYRTGMPINRQNLMASNKTNSDKDKDIISAVGQNGGSFGTIVYHNEYKKFNNPVIIEKGDTVTYYIEVYNNSRSKRRDVEVQDYFSIINTQNEDKASVIVKKTTGNINTDIEDNTIYIESVQKVQSGSTSNLSYEIETDSGKISFAKFDMEDSEKVTIIITAKINIQAENDVIRNYANLTKDSTKYRTQDADYVVTRKYAVSLEKFITKVTSKDSSGEYKDEQIITGRNGHRYNSNAVDKTQNYDSWKKDHKVEVEPGDIVTYTIRLVNTGETQVKITEIADYFTFTNSAKLEYIEDYGVQNTAGEKVGNIKETINGTNIIKYQIELTNAVLLNPNQYTDITICFKVNIPVEYTNESRVLYNVAVITNLANKNDCSVLDSDGTDNNQDEDVVKTKTYAVSLEKFVTKVTSKDNSGEYKDEKNITGRDGHRYNRNAVDKTQNYDSWKNNNPVQVEPGDKVIFTIRLKNTGDTLVKITSLKDTFTNENGVKLEYDTSYGVKGNGDGLYKDGIITFPNPKLLNPGESTDITICFKVNISSNNTSTSHSLYNIASIENFANKNDWGVLDSDGTDNNQDEDVVKTKTYAVSLEKFVYAVNGNTNLNPRDTRLGKPIYSKPNGNKDDDASTWNPWKWRNPVVVNKDDEVTYEIRITNDGDTNIKTLTITDYILGEELEENGTGFYGSYWGNFKENPSYNLANKVNNVVKNGLLAKETKYIRITLKVTEDNISLDTLTNRAEITNMTNKNDVSVNDTTLNNNMDEDYIILDDITISGKVWNDIALDKEQETYNGIYDSVLGVVDGKEIKESLLPGIKVSLYRTGISNPIATTTTNDNGEYTFSKSSINSSIPAYAKYIKAPKAYGYWKPTDSISPNKNSAYGKENKSDTYGTLVNGYYSYTIEFDYDGIKYTSTVFAELTSRNENDSNAQENLVTRTSFNNQFETVDTTGAHHKGKTINMAYTTKNEEGYIPQSNYVYDANTMSMQSSTNRIQLSKNADIEKALGHVNLGLRGRDIFDLELYSDVSNVCVKVNNVQGIYQHTNKRNPIIKENTNIAEDMANIANEIDSTTRRPEFNTVEQKIRQTDIDYRKTGGTYTSTGLQIEVTYQLTVKNASVTSGEVTQISDYFDNKYNYKNAYAANGTNLEVTIGNSGNGYKSVVINTPSTRLEESDEMNIYLVLELNDAENTLRELLATETTLPTYNLAEISGYKAYRSSQQTEFTRGLIDKDSAPGSVNKETVRTTQNQGQNTSTTEGNPSTLEYYYNKDNLTIFKYEDDTSTSPVLYIMVDDNERIITGTVFEDKTTTNETTKIKTGNGRLDAGEIGVYGATVELVELVDGYPVRYTVETEKNGTFSIEGFLPGNYVIRYRYGDTEKTVLLHQGEEGINKNSYNGENYQATNNIGKLSVLENFWYIINETEGISTAKDNAARRKQVGNNVVAFNDEKMTSLNNFRDMIGTYSDDNNGTLTAKRKYNSTKTEIMDIAETKITGIKKIIEDTNMYATTPIMRFTLEKPFVKDGEAAVEPTFGEYEITNMNFGIAEVPVTIIGFEKRIQALTITDSTGNNVLASIERDANGIWNKPTGDVLATPTSVDISIEQEKIQGAKLNVTFAITTSADIEINYDNTPSQVPKINGVVDFVDNNLSYNSELSYNGNKNSDFWEIITHESLMQEFEKSTYKDGIVPKGTIDPEGTKHTTTVKAKANNPILLKAAGTGTAMITLERVLSATDAASEGIITTMIDGLSYINQVEFTGFTYPTKTIDPPDSDNPVDPPDSDNPVDPPDSDNPVDPPDSDNPVDPPDSDNPVDPTDPGNPVDPTDPSNPVDPTDPDNPVDPTDPERDLIRNNDGYIILPGVQYDSAMAEVIIIHPPTGSNSIHTTYLIVGIIALAIIGLGTIGIRKFAIRSKE